MELIKNKSNESITAMGQFVTHVDETVMPDQCDPTLFALTFELRSQRYEIEQAIDGTKTHLKLLTNISISLGYAELDAVEHTIKQLEIELEKTRVSILLRKNINLFTSILHK